MNVSIVGGSGYAGGELLRILLDHPHVTIQQVTSERFAGQPVTRVHPNLRSRTQIMFSKVADLTKCDLLFVSLPNKVSMTKMGELMKLADKIIDLGADFRLRDQKSFESWYGVEHENPILLNKFVYGIAELHRDDLKKASFVACGGCEATVSILALYPLVKHGLITDRIIIDAKMSSSQAGGKPGLSSHHPERAGVVRSYQPSGHRHTAEIEQELGLTDKKISVAISATAIDMVRGLLVTIHAVPKKDLTEKDVWNAYRAEYAHEPFIRIVKEAQGLYRYPEPKILQGSNFCDIGFELDTKTNRLVIIAAIDNLVKGTAGQAVQSMNLMCGFPETTALTFPGLHPI
ncbi:N-acetyl-gamma-glutamyl-phosphate reductase [Candidatus Microgenomates bacterium]|nr:MAG: N-acetyl-gamma-glutamyl-phosphate reductase [Candidatus Microgenomates bacterium]